MEIRKEGDSNDLRDANVPPSHEQHGSIEKTEINLNGVAKTLLITLVARAYDFSSTQPILRDAYA